MAIGGRVDHLQIDDLHIDQMAHLRIHYTQIYHLRIDHLRIDHLRIDHLQVDHLQISHLVPHLPLGEVAQDLSVQHSTIRIDHVDPTPNKCNSRLCLG